ncbi:MAG: diversity-generating retroelement protein Avd [Bryobacteraceae bacterium]|nr:diversity-generating retroelement protein Avd [Bryobacteraceae bacterium]
MKSTNEDEPAVVVVRAYDFVRWLIPKAERFPRNFRFSLGERLVAASLDLLLDLVEAAYASDKSRALERAARCVNSVRYLVRLSKDLKIMTVESYGFACERIEEIGRMTGGWQKANRKRE